MNNTNNDMKMAEQFQTSSTVQRGDTSVPAREGVQTGLNSSLSSDRLNSRVDPMALLSSNASNATGSKETAQMEVDAQQTNFPPISGKPVAPVNTHAYRERINSLPTVTGQQSPMDRLGSKIEELAEFIKDKRNLHHELRKLVASIATAYKLANKPATKSARTTQTSPGLNKKSQSFLVTPEKTQHGEQNNKKRPLSTPSPSSEIDKPAQKKPPRDDTWTKVTWQKKRKETKQEPAAQSREAQNQPSTADTKKRRRKKTRTKAVLVQPAEGRTYADLLKEIKAKVSPVETGVDIRSIKKTKHGGVLLEMARKTEDSKAFTDAVKAATANIGTVKMLTPTTTIEILDLDEISTESEVREALKREFTDNLEVKRVNLTKPTPRGNRAAFCEVDEPSAIKALDKARIRIGLVNCRIRLVVKVTRCFKCLGFGHQTRRCAGPDRSRCCYKCGGENHKAVNCMEKLKCFLCASDKDAQDGLCHISGTGACKAFRKALAKATRGQK